MKNGKTWRLMDSGPGNAAWNMAVDEAMLLAASGGPVRPTLRFFSWDTPSLSIGSFQKAEELDMATLKERGVPLVRRPTGGRAVLHDAELTYSVVCPIPSEYFPSDLMGSYKTIGSCFLEGLRGLGLDASLVPVSKNPDRKSGTKRGRDPLCFSSPSWYEVLAGGRKLIGSAQRRLKGAFLQQGSLIIIQDAPALVGLLRFNDQKARDAAENTLRSKMTSISEHISRTGLQALKIAVSEGFKSTMGVSFVEEGLSKDEMRLTERLYAEKYSNDDWNIHRRSRSDLA